MIKSIWARFWSYVERGGPEECWEWRTHRGHEYGKFWANGRRWLSHRWLWRLLHGEIPVGKVIRHKCDNTKCVNPAHLELGTQQDNIRDCTSKLRHPRGETSGASKITEKDAGEIICLIKRGWSNPQIADRFGLDKTHISKIRHGKKWKHLPR